MKIIKELIPYVIIIILVLIIRTYIITPVIVQGTSMSNTLEDQDILFLNKFDTSYERFDIVVLEHDSSKLVKRIIGLPGEHIYCEDNKIYIDGQLIEEDYITEKTEDFDILNAGLTVIPEGYYFVLGDNRTNSTDSRSIGLISEEDIEGTTNFRIFPLNYFGFFN